MGLVAEAILVEIRACQLVGILEGTPQVLVVEVHEISVEAFPDDFRRGGIRACVRLGHPAEELLLSSGELSLSDASLGVIAAGRNARLVPVERRVGFALEEGVGREPFDLVVVGYFLKAFDSKPIVLIGLVGELRIVVPGLFS